jgi:hypothetical protein
LRIELGLVAAPGPATELAEELAEDLPESLPDGVEWSVPVVSDPDLPDSGGIETIDAARERMRKEGWDLAVCITDLPLRIGRRPVVAHASATHRVALLSLPALGALHLHRRALESIVRLVDGLLGENLDLDARHGPARRARVADRLKEMGAAVRRELPDDDDVDLRFVAAVVRGNLRLLAGMVRTNRPWRLIVRLSRALAAAVAAVAFALVTSDIWRISDRAGWGSLLVIALVALVGTIVWLIAAHGLWERTTRRDREQVVLFNAATTLTVALGVATLYATVFVVAFAGARLMIDRTLLAQQIGHAVTVADYLGLAWLVSSLATVGGALGSALESDVAVREAAYGYRPERATEHEAAGQARAAA